MVVCCAYRCKSRSEKKEPEITFHRFPLKNVERTKLWVQNMKILNWWPGKNDRLCSKHFEQKLFYKIGDRIGLLDEAVPTIFPEFTHNPCRKRSQRKPLPKNPEVKKSWLNLSETKKVILPMNPKVSSALFKEQNFDDKPTEEKFLPDTVAPCISNPWKNRISRHSANFSSDNDMDDTKLSYEIDTEDDSILIEDNAQILIVSDNSLDISPEKVEHDTNKRSPVEIKIQQSDESDSDDQHVEKMFVEPHDLDSEALSNLPQNSSKLSYMQSKIERDKKTMRMLRQKIRRLKVKQNTLNMLFRYLRDNDLLTATGHSVVSAFVSNSNRTG